MVERPYTCWTCFSTIMSLDIYSFSTKTFKQSLHLKFALQILFSISDAIATIVASWKASRSISFGQISSYISSVSASLLCVGLFVFFPELAVNISRLSAQFDRWDEVISVFTRILRYADLKFSTDGLLLFPQFERMRPKKDSNWSWLRWNVGIDSTFEVATSSWYSVFKLCILISIPKNPVCFLVFNTLTLPMVNFYFSAR